MQVHRLKSLAAGLTFAAVAALVVHQLAYLVVYPSFVDRADALGEHGHVSVQWALATPLAVLAATVFILRQVRNLGVAAPVRTLPISATAAALFVAQELTEGAIKGTSVVEGLQNPALILGVCIAPLVVSAMFRTLRSVGEFVVDLVLQLVVRPVLRSRLFTSSTEQTILAVLPVSPAAPRGPPMRFVLF